MLIVLSLVLVAAIAAGVAAVASGVGDRMSEPQRDLVDPGLPSRHLDASHVTGLRLQTAIRGYRMDQVDDVLDRLRDELAGRDEVLRAVAAEESVPTGLRSRAQQWAPPHDAACAEVEALQHDWPSTSAGRGVPVASVPSEPLPPVIAPDQDATTGDRYDAATDGADR